MKHLYLKTTVFLTVLYSNFIQANPHIKPPQGFSSSGQQTLDDSSENLFIMMGVIFGICVAVSCYRPAISWLKGDRKEGIVGAMDIVIGAVVGSSLAGLVFWIVS